MAYSGKCRGQSINVISSEGLQLQDAPLVLQASSYLSTVAFTGHALEPLHSLEKQL